MELLAFIEVFANMAGAIGALVSTFLFCKIYLDRRAQSAPVGVFLLSEEGEEVELPLFLTRRDLSRAELLGRLGMLPMRAKGTRFALKALSGGQFLQDLNKVAAGQSDRLHIPASREEIDQFDL
jgi:hypothetical protein